MGIFEKEERVLLSALKVGAVNFLVTHASDGRIRAVDAMPLMLSKDYGDTARRVVAKMLLSKVRSKLIFNKK